MATPDTKCSSGEQEEDGRKPVLLGESDACARTDDSSVNLGRRLVPLFFSGLFCSVQPLSGHVGCIQLREAPACFLTAQTFLGDPWVHEQSRPQASLQPRPNSQHGTRPQELISSSRPFGSKPPSGSTRGSFPNDTFI